MKEQESRLEELFNLYVQKSLTTTEERELMQLLIDPELAQQKESIIDRMYELDPIYTLSESQASEIFSNIIESPAILKKSTPVRIFSLFRWVAAASFLLMIGIGAYYFIEVSKYREVAKASKMSTSDISAPVKNRAMITLANGQKLFLDSARNGKLFQNDGVAIVKMADGKIAYTGTSKELVYNTLSNPKGSKVIDMILADGSHVWLNSGSSLTFPLAFQGNERKVSITGEAYFEVAKNASMPFKVSVAGKCEIAVLGTHFNINSYDDEASINTTLLEGKVKVTGLATGEYFLIAPGQQVQMSSDSKMTINTRPNLEGVMAWKNGYLHFENADLKTIMRQLARWYDVEVVYQGELPKRQFAGELQLDLKLSQMLKILETNNVHFKIEEGKKLLVTD